MSTLRVGSGQAVDVAALRQQSLRPEAEEKHEYCADQDLAQGKNDGRMSREIGEEARRLLDQHDHDHYAQDDALDISSTSNQDGRVKNDCFDRRPCRWIEGAQVRGE